MLERKFFIFLFMVYFVPILFRMSMSSFFYVDQFVTHKDYVLSNNLFDLEKVVLG